MQINSGKGILALLSIIVIASGCVNNDNQQGQVKISQKEGLVIQSFTATPSEIPAGQPITLRMMLKNKGGRQAKNIQAMLYNVPFGSGPRAWKKGGTSLVKGPGDIGNLRAADPEADAPSLQKPVVWSGLTAPSLEQGVSIPYDFFGRVYYEYSTKGTTNIRVMDAQRQRETGATRSKPEVDNSGAPVQLKVRTLTPIVFYGNSGAPTNNFCVIAENVGSGTVVPKGTGVKSAGSAENQIRLTVKTSGNTLTFPKETSSENTRTVTKQMVSGEAVKCFKMQANFGQTNIQQTVPVTITAEYGYYVEDQASVTVNGRPQ